MKKDNSQVKMKEKIKYDCVALPHPIAYFNINIPLFFCTIAVFMLFNIDGSRVFYIINIVLAVIVPIIFIVVFVFTTFSGWNSPVYFSQVGVMQKSFGRIAEWKWCDIIDITCKTHRPLFLRQFFIQLEVWPPKFKLKIIGQNKLIVFTLNAELRKIFPTLCTNKEINLKYMQLLSECDFGFQDK